ncbi:MAG: hypothetical protein AMXMBFR53_24060 [Gemmatimonadota bacterium]
MIASGLRALAAAALVAGPAAAQGPEGTYASPQAEALHRAALDHRERRDDALLRYTAVVRQRVGAGLRMPLKDRTLYRAEAASRVFWWRDGRTLVQVLAVREQTPLGVTDATHLGLMDQAFDPRNDALFLGLVEPDEMDGPPDPDDFWFEHPLTRRWTDHYRFSVGDTLRLALPDGRGLEAVELRVVPTQADVHRMTGSLWVEPESGALVRAAYRLSETFDALRDIGGLREEEERDLRHVPGLLKPWTFDLSLVAVEYALWDFDVWLPRSLRLEGVARAGILTAPAEVELTYDVESVLTRAEAEAGATETEALPCAPEDDGTRYVVEPGWTHHRDPDGRRRTVRYLIPEDPAVLATSPHLPPPIWEEAPGFLSREEVDELTGGLAGLPAPPRGAGMPRTFRWGLQRPDLVRYNRVEGLSMGARAQALPTTPLGPLSVTATLRLGTQDRVPNGRLDLTREGLRARVTLSGYHELAALDEDARHLGLGNSLTALFLGRDDGDYYRRAGARLEWTPPAADRRSFRVAGFAERHFAVEAGDPPVVGRLGSDTWSFRPNVRAEGGWDAGGLAEIAPWWGTDPRLAQGGITLALLVGAGDWAYRRATGSAALAVPLPLGLRLATEVAGGTSWGAPPPQRGFLLGGATTLRGYEPGVMAGTSFARVRGELARPFAFGAVTLFSDGGWAGPRPAFDAADALWSAGVGLSLVDGLIRTDAAWGLSGSRGFRLELYLDGIL